MNLVKNNPLTYSLAIATAFFIINYIFLHYGHFHEDAYILFIYVENILNGNGITYYPSGDPIEGATDFLWMILIFALTVLGFDVGTAAILMNSAGVLIVSYIISSEISSIRENSIAKSISFIVLPIGWLSQSYLLAALGGFSVFFYMSIIASILYLLYKEKLLLWIPILSVVLGLIRPDGVILGFGFVLSGLILNIKKNKTKKYIISVAAAVILGGSYFIWRYLYFGNLLPLPLYVKSADGLLSGTYSNFKWLKDYGGLIYLSAIISLSILFKKTKKTLLLLIPFIFLFIALSTATQSQNIGYRFQAPLFIILYLIMSFFIKETIEKNYRHVTNKTKKLVILIISIFLASTLFNNIKSLKKASRLTEFNYINDFPAKLNTILNKNNNKNITIVLTEAGRLAYWNQNEKNKIIDIVGLNTVYPAKNSIDEDYIKSLDPDLLMFHHAGTLELNKSENTKKTKKLTNKDALLSKKEKENNKVLNAAIVASSYIYKNFESYDVLLVDYNENGNFDHIYAIKKDLEITKKIQNSIDYIFKKREPSSYFQVKSKIK